jgi:hypothetical protein
VRFILGSGPSAISLMGEVSKVLKTHSDPDTSDLGSSCSEVTDELSLSNASVNSAQSLVTELGSSSDGSGAGPGPRSANKGKDKYRARPTKDNRKKVQTSKSEKSKRDPRQQLRQHDISAAVHELIAQNAGLNDALKDLKIEQREALEESNPVLKEMPPGAGAELPGGYLVPHVFHLDFAHTTSLSWEQVVTAPVIAMYRAFRSVLSRPWQILHPITLSWSLGWWVRRFSFFPRFHYRVRQAIAGPESDLRADAIALGKLIHANPLLHGASVSLRWLGVTLMKKRMTVSVEVMSQCMVAKNMVPTAAPEDTWDRIYNTAKSLHSVAIDKYTALTVGPIIEDSALFAMGKWRHNMESRCLLAYPESPALVRVAGCSPTVIGIVRFASQALHRLRWVLLLGAGAMVLAIVRPYACRWVATFWRERLLPPLRFPILTLAMPTPLRRGCDAGFVSDPRIQLLSFY